MIKAIRKLSAVDEVFQYLHGRIVSGDLPPGHRFPPQEVMAEELGVSRSTVREALNKLTLLGMLTAKPGVGTIVGQNAGMGYVANFGQFIFLDSDELTQFVEARLYLEKAAIRLAVLKGDKDDIRNLSKIIAAQGEAVADGDSELFSELDARFHRTIIEISRNQVLMQFMGLIWDGLSQFIVEVTKLRQALEHAFYYHGLIVKYLADRNLPKAEKALLEHLQNVAQNIETNSGHDMGMDEMFKIEMEKL